MPAATPVCVCCTFAQSGLQHARPRLGCLSTSLACSVPWAPAQRHKPSRGRGRCPRRAAAAFLAGLHVGNSSLGGSQARVGPPAAARPHQWQVSGSAWGGSSGAAGVRAALATAPGQAVLAEPAQGDVPVGGPRQTTEAREGASDEAAAAVSGQPLPARAAEPEQGPTGSAPTVGAASTASGAAVEPGPVLVEQSGGLAAAAGPALATEWHSNGAAGALTEADTGLRVRYGTRAPPAGEPPGRGGAADLLPESDPNSRLQPHTDLPIEGESAGCFNAAEALTGGGGELRAGAVAPAGGDAGNVAGGLPEAEQLRRRRISHANRGRTPWNAGRPHSAGAAACSPVASLLLRCNERNPQILNCWAAARVIALLSTVQAVLCGVSVICDLSMRAPNERVAGRAEEEDSGAHAGGHAAARGSREA